MGSPASDAPSTTELLDHLDLGVTAFDQDFKLWVCNTRFLELMDIPSDVARVGAALEDLIRYNAERGEYGPGDVDEQVRQSVARAERLEAHRFERVRPDGTVLEIRGAPLPNGGFVTTYADITERKRAEEALASKQAQLQVALDNMPGGMMLGDEDLNFVLFNRQYVDLFELPEDLIEIGGSLRDELHYQAARGDFGPGDEDELVEQVVAIYRRDEAVSYERTIPGGRTLHVNLAPTPEGGRVEIATDITERKRADDRARAELKRIEEELQSARELQLAMVPQEFPPPSRHRPLAFAAVMEPAREVGGDFYDVIELDEHRVGVVIGDVSGKGAGAALFMARAFTTLNAAAERGGTPGAVLSLLNDVMCAGNDTFMFVTVFYGVFDGATGVLTFANAGHNPPLVLRADRSVEELAMTGDFAVGVKPGHGYGERSVELRSGELLFCYTDGIIDAVNAAGDQFSEAGLTGALRTCQHITADGLVSHVLDGVSAFTGHTPQFDDITCVAMEHLASDGAVAAPGSAS